MDAVQLKSQPWIPGCMDIGDRIKSARERTGMNAPELARVLRVSKSTVYNWEQGRAIPSAENIFDLEDTTGVSARWIVRGDGEMYTNAPRAASSDLKLDNATADQLTRVLRQILELNSRTPDQDQD